MPYRSLAQQRYFHANRLKLATQGVDVAEYDEASKGKKLPERVNPKKVKTHVYPFMSAMKAHEKAEGKKGEKKEGKHKDIIKKKK